MKRILFATLGALYLLHNDFWFWDRSPAIGVLGGLPAGFVYHVAFCVAVSVVLALLIRHAWPANGPANGPAAEPKAGPATEPTSRP